MKGHYKKNDQTACGQLIQGTDDYATDDEDLIDCRPCLKIKTGLVMSVVGIIYNENFDVLCVSRKENPEQWNLPGGKVEPQDFDTDHIYSFVGLKKALSREVLEETGLSFPYHNFSSVYATVVKNYYSTFMDTDPISAEGNRLIPEKGTKIKWMRLKDLMEVCPFKEVLQRAIMFGAFEKQAYQDL